MAGMEISLQLIGSMIRLSTADCYICRPGCYDPGLDEIGSLFKCGVSHLDASGPILACSANLFCAGVYIGCVFYVVSADR